MRIARFPFRLLAPLALALCLALPGQGGTAAAAAQPAPVAEAAPAAASPAPAVASPALEPAIAGPGAGAPAGAPAGDAGDAGAAPGGGTADTSTRGLDEQIQGLKKEVIDLNKDLFMLEEELLFPANTQVAVFVSMDVGDFFGLDSVTLKIDNHEVSNYLYTPRETAALVKGGVQRLYLGNLKAGQHELVAFFSGKGPNDRDYRRGASIKFEKGIGAKYLELKISDKARRQQPEFEIRDWE